jgi:hypothetical protein
MLWAPADSALTARAGEAGTHRAPSPHPAQVCRVRRRRVDVRTGEVENRIAYVVASLPPDRADAARLPALPWGHWGIGNRLQHGRDVTVEEDRGTVRTAVPPRVCAACRKLIVARWRLVATNIAAAGRQAMK